MNEYLGHLWDILLDASPYLVLGLFLSALMKFLLPMEKVKKHLGQANLWSVLKASFIGVPLPLCSCSVVPTALTLRQSGASKASTSAFLISTPETGVDSLSVTYAMMDIPMMIFRMLSAFITATVAGVFNIMAKTENSSYLESHQNHSHSHEHQNESTDTKPCCGSKKKELSKQSELKAAFRYAFIKLFDDIAGWMTIGFLLAAFISYALPEDALAHLGPHESRMLVALVGIPIYICASATTPLAASLVLKGLSPGAALMLLLVGPATNISNLLVLKKELGVKTLALNLLAIVLVSLLASYGVDAFYAGKDISHWSMHAGTHQSHETSLFTTLVTSVFSIYLAYRLFCKYVMKK